MGIPFPSTCHPARREPWRRCDTVGSRNALRETKPIAKRPIPETNGPEATELLSSSAIPSCPSGASRAHRPAHQKAHRPAHWFGRISLVGEGSVPRSEALAPIRLADETPKRTEGNRCNLFSGWSKRQATRSAPVAHQGRTQGRTLRREDAAGEAAIEPPPRSHPARRNEARPGDHDCRNEPGPTIATPCRISDIAPSRQRTEGAPRGRTGRRTAQTWTSSLCPRRLG